jgi:probable HAF family extracellular repeat protein
VVGQAEMGGLSPRAFFWKEGFQPVNLGNLSGRATDTSLAKAVSDNGTVVGWSGDAMWGDQEAFIWTASGGMQSLAAFLAARDVKIPRGMVLTAAMDISGDGGTVVGLCRDKDWNQGYWRIRLGDAPAPAPVVNTNPWEPKPLDHIRPDSLDTFPADMLNPFPFGKRKF